MATFYGSVQGCRGEVHRLGGEKSGMNTVCASWDGAVRCWAFIRDGVPWVHVALGQWTNGAGPYPEIVLYDGPFSGKTADNVSVEDVVSYVYGKKEQDGNRQS